MLEAALRRFFLAYNRFGVPPMCDITCNHRMEARCIVEDCFWWKIRVLFSPFAGER